MTFNPDRPNNDLPLLPPKADCETRAVLKKAISANKALAELKSAGELIPDQGVLIQTIGLQEAKLSSEIENIVTTNDELYRAFADSGHQANPHTKEVLSYKEALWFGYNELKIRKRPLSTSLFEDVYRIIKQTTAGVRKLPGTKLVNPSKKVIYTPPDGEGIIRDKLANLEQFLNASDDVDPLVKMAIAHYQFEAIHPFTDGNGRTGRVINILYLIERELLEIPVLYLSRHIIDNKPLYYSGLLRITTHKDWEPWILFMLDAIEQTAKITRKRIVDIRNLMHETGELVKNRVPAIYSKDMIEVLYRQPYCKIKTFEEAGLGHRQTVSNYLKKLEEIGILNSIKKGRETYYVNSNFLELLAK